MIKIFCTKKLAEMLPEMPKKCDEPVSTLDKWCVNFISAFHKKVVIAMCADTGFGFILYGVTKAQFAKLPELILQGIRKTFDYYGIRNEITDDYLSGTPELFIGADRKETARLNRLSIDVSNYFYYEQPSELMDLSFVRRINHRIVGTANNDTFIPLECMLEGLETRYNMKPVCRPAFTMTAAMDFGAFETRRQLTIPVEYTFAEFHKVLQIAFGWKDYHMYEFLVGENRIACAEDELDSEPVLAANALLSEYLQEGDTFTYCYDFGDGWEVSVHVDSLQADFDRTHPICTECVGAAPPEDVGGIDGFLSFLEIYNNPDHPEHKEMHEWVGYLWEPEPNIKRINAWLK